MSTSAAQKRDLKEGISPSDYSVERETSPAAPKLGSVQSIAMEAEAPGGLNAIPLYDREIKGLNAAPQIRSRKSHEQHAANARSPIARILIDKHREYYLKARFYRLFYFFNRLIAAIGASVLTYLIVTEPRLAVVISIIVAASVATELVLDPYRRWKLFSQATNAFTMADARMSGDFEQYKDHMLIYLRTEHNTAELDADMDGIHREY